MLAMLVLGEGEGMLFSRMAMRPCPWSAAGEILGFGATADAFHLTAPEPEGKGAARAITALPRRRWWSR